VPDYEVAPLDLWWGIGEHEVGETQKILEKGQMVRPRPYLPEFGDLGGKKRVW